MINHRIIAIIKREIKAQIFTKKFIFMTLSFPLIMATIFGVMFFIGNYEQEEKSFLTIFTESEQFQTQLQTQFNNGELNDDALYELTYLTSNRAGLEDYIENNHEALLDGNITGVVFIPDSAKADKEIEYYSNNPSNQGLLNSVSTEINISVIDQYFNERNIDQASIAYARLNISVDGTRITTDGTAEETFSNLIVAVVLTFLLYMSLLIAGPTVMGVVNEEKTNKVIEVLLSSVTSNELMAGKVIGTAIAFLAQMFIWLLPAILLSTGSLPMLAAFGDFELDLNLFTLIYYLLNYLIGMLIYLSIFSVFGAIFDNPQEAQSSMFPVIMLILIPFFVAMTMVDNPANSLAEVGSMLPFFSIIIMPARMTLIDVPLWQVGLAFIVNIATFFFVIRIAGKLYRIAILVTGKRPGFKEIIKWVRYS